MGNLICRKIDFSKNIYIKLSPIYYQYKNYDDFLENKEKYIISYKKLTKNDIIRFMTKHFKNNNYILEFDNNNDYSIENIKTDKNFIIINVRYKNITKNYNINYYKDWIEDGLYKYFSSGDLLTIKKCSKKNNIYLFMSSIFEVYQ